MISLRALFMYRDGEVYKMDHNSIDVNIDSIEYIMNVQMEDGTKCTKVSVADMELDVVETPKQIRDAITQKRKERASAFCTCRKEKLCKE